MLACRDTRSPWARSSPLTRRSSSGWKAAQTAVEKTRKRSGSLSILLIINFAASVLHFGDNMLHFREYPEPAWISGPHVVDALWLLITPLLGAGWYLARRERKWASVAVLWSYGVLSMFVLGHYLYAPPSSLSFRVNFFILLEASAAALLILLAPILVPGRGLAAARQARNCRVPNG